MYKIADYVRVVDQGDYYLIQYRKIWKVNKAEQIVEIMKMVTGDGIAASSDLVHTTFFNFLRRHNFVKKDRSANSLVNPRLYYYIDGTVKDTDQAFELLDSLRVCIVGLGGVGSEILQLLCGSHVSRFLLIDFDRVEESNLNRQFIYSKQDTGRLKTDVCVKYAQTHVDNPNHIYSVNEQIRNSAQLVAISQSFNPTIFVAAADSPRNIREIIKMAALELQSQVIEGGVGPDFASYSFPSDNQNQQIEKESHMSSVFNGKIVHDREVSYGSYGPTNSIISAMMANDIIMKTIGANGFGNYDGSQTFLDFTDFSVESGL